MNATTPDLGIIKDVWKLILPGKDSVIELRAIHYQDKTKVQWQIYWTSAFNSNDGMKLAFERKALSWNVHILPHSDH